jgi:release factor glutamine methyltransferase
MKKEFIINNETITIKIFPSMAEPSVGYTEFLLKNLSCQGKIAIDLGCGTGIIAIALVKRGFDLVYAVDIHEDYITATQYNTELNNVSEKIIALKSDLFKAIPQDIRFDAIIANLPSTPAWDKIPLYSQAGEDGRQHIDNMLRQAQNWLAPNGTIEFTHSSRISLEQTKQLMNELGYEYDEPISQLIKCKQHHYFELYPDYLEKLLSNNSIYVENGIIFEWNHIIKAYFSSNKDSNLIKVNK